MNQQTTNANAITTRDAEAQNILSAANEGMDKLLRFKKGAYLIGDDPVPLGTEYLAHATAWTKAWVKYVEGIKPVRKFYRVARGERPPEREELGDLDETAWPIGHDGRRSDPWVLQYWLPVENLETGEVAIFYTSTFGGRLAISDLCREYAKRIQNGQSGQPIVQLAVAEMPTKNFGKVLRPEFEVVHWDDAAGDSVAVETSLATANTVETPPRKAVTGKRSDMDDEIPF